MFEKPQKAQAVRIVIEAVSLDSTSMAPSLEEPLLARGCGYPWMPIAVDEKYSEIGEGLQCGASAQRRSSANNGRSGMRSIAVVSDYLALGGHCKSRTYLAGTAQHCRPLEPCLASLEDCHQRVCHPLPGLLQGLLHAATSVRYFATRPTHGSQDAPQYVGLLPEPQLRIPIFVPSTGNPTSMSIYRKIANDVPNEIGITGTRRESQKSENQSPADAAREELEKRKRSKGEPSNVVLPRTLAWADRLLSDVRTDQLIRSFPRIANLLALTWDEPEATYANFDRLFVDRRGNRRGFPPEVLSELAALRRYYGTVHPQMPSDMSRIKPR